MNKPVYLGISVLEIKQYNFRYDHMKPKYRQKAKLCYMYTDNFLVHIKTEDIKDITKFVET